MRSAAINLNGIGIAYVVGFVNAALAAINAFGLNLNDTQRVAIVTLVNSALVLAIHLAHRVGEASLNDNAHDLAKSKMDQAAAPDTPG